MSNLNKRKFEIHLAQMVFVGFSWLLTLSASAQIATPSVDHVANLYESQGIPFRESTGRPALLVLSAGCGQCVELATSYEKEFIYLLTKRDLNTRFIEMPGAVSRPDFSRDEVEVSGKKNSNW